MSNEEIIKGNKLIAEFMGVKSQNRKYTNSPNDNGVEIFFYPIPNTDQAFLKAASELMYQESWDWLMPVVEKISKLNLPDPDGVSETWQPYPRTFGMQDEDTGNFMFRFNRHVCFGDTTLIMAAWRAVVDFIKSNNSQQQPT